MVMLDGILKYGGCSKVLAKGSKFQMSFDIASRTIITDSSGRIVECYACCEPCRSERVLRMGDMIFNEVKPYRVVPVFGSLSGITFRIGNFTNEVRKASRIQNNTNFGGCTFWPQHGDYDNAGFDLARVVEGIENKKAIVANTHYTLKNGAMVSVEYPCKTINYLKNTPFVQVDTGMLAVATNVKCSHITKTIRLAYAAFSEESKVNFIMEDYLPSAHDLLSGADFVDAAVMDCRNSFFIER
jgi:hypothetical protein